MSNIGHWSWAFFAWAVILLVTGCGGGGGGNVNVPPPPPPSQGIVVNVPANQAFTKNFDNWTLNVPVGTFPTGSTLTVNTSDTVTLPGKATDIAITTSVDPKGPVYIDLPAQTKGIVDFSYVLFNKVAGTWHKVAEGAKNAARITVEKTVFYAKTASGTVIKTVWGGPTEATALLVYADDPLYGFEDNDRVLVLVHGLNETSAEMRNYAARTLLWHRYSRIYLFAYPWEQDAAISAKSLSSYINQLSTQHDGIDIGSHSAGACVSDYAVFRIPTTNTKKITRLFSINGAHNGSLWANSAGGVDRLMENQLIDKEGTIDGVINHPLTESPILSQLCLGSSFVSNLYAVNPGVQRVHAPIANIAGDFDLVVGQASGLGSGIRYPELTYCPVNRVTLKGGHNSLVYKNVDIDRVLNYLYTGDGVQTILWTVPDQINNLLTDQWRYPLTIWNNDTAITGTITAVSLDKYDASGTWVGIYWYDQTARDFIAQYSEYNKVLLPRQLLEIPITEYTMPDRTDAEQPSTSVYNIYFTENGHAFVWDHSVTLLYGGIWPATPITRKR